jgi:hypothetical protein
MATSNSASLVMRAKAMRRPSGENTGSTSKAPLVSCLAPEPSARMIQMSVWKPGSSGKSGEALNVIQRPSGDHLGTSWIPSPKVSWRTWRPLGSMVAMWTPVSSTKSKAIRRPSGDQSEKKLGTWVSRRW